MKEKILVTGATGVVGPVLVNMLVDKGYCVTILSRQMPENIFFSEKVEVQLGDVTDISSVKRAVEGVSAIFHLAAKLHDNSSTVKYMQECRKINVTGTRNIVKCAKAAAVKKIIFFSTINVYGKSSENVIFKESSPPLPLTCYARSKFAAEKLVLAAGKKKKSGISCTVLRVAAVYGRGMKGNYLHLVRMLRKGFFIRMGNGENCRTLIYVDDLAEAAILALESPRADGEIFNVTDNVFYTYNSIIAAIGNALEKKFRTLAFSEKVSGIVIKTLKAMAIVRIPFALRAAGLIEKQMESIKVSGDKIRRVLGFNPRYSLEKGWKEVL